MLQKGGLAEKNRRIKKFIEEGGTAKITDINLLRLHLKILENKEENNPRKTRQLMDNLFLLADTRSHDYDMTQYELDLALETIQKQRKIIQKQNEKIKHLE